MTISEWITASLKRIGVLAAGETASSEDFADALAELNRLLKSWSADGINLHYRVHESLSLVSGDGDYSIGTSGDFNTARPNEIEQAFIRDSGGGDHPLRIRPIAEYWSLENKSSSTRPSILYYDPTYPTGTIYFNSLPSEVETLHLVSQKPLTADYDDSADDVSLPGEYEVMFIDGLAIRLAPNYGKSVSIELASGFKNAYDNVRARNLANSMIPARVSMPGRNSGTYNIDTDG